MPFFPLILFDGLHCRTKLATALEEREGESHQDRGLIPPEGTGELLPIFPYIDQWGGKQV